MKTLRASGGVVGGVGTIGFIGGTMPGSRGVEKWSRTERLAPCSSARTCTKLEFARSSV